MGGPPAPVPFHIGLSVADGGRTRRARNGSGKGEGPRPHSAHAPDAVGPRRHPHVLVLRALAARGLGRRRAVRDHGRGRDGRRAARPPAARHRPVPHASTRPTSTRTARGPTPVGLSTVLGPDDGVTSELVEADFDDVDDFHGRPAQVASAPWMDESIAFTDSVAVRYVTVDVGTVGVATSASPTLMKEVTVVVRAAPRGSSGRPRSRPRSRRSSPRAPASHAVPLRPPGRGPGRHHAPGGVAVRAAARGQSAVESSIRYQTEAQALSFVETLARDLENARTQEQAKDGPRALRRRRDRRADRPRPRTPPGAPLADHDPSGSSS